MVMSQHLAQSNGVHMKQIANADARLYIQRREPFKGSNLWGEKRMTQGVLSTHDYVDWEDSSELYVVCSYGVHYPMWVYDFFTGQWFGNHDKYSRTTSKHKSQTQPCEGTRIRWYDTQTMVDLMVYGYRGLASRRILYGGKVA